MSEDLIVELGKNALKTTAMISAPLLLGALAIGMLVSVFQAITQINESTLTFIPKMIVVALIFVLAGPWMLDILTHYTTDLFTSMATIIREGQ